MRKIGWILVLVLVLAVDASAQVDTAWVRNWSSDWFQDDSPICLTRTVLGHTVVACKSDTFDIHVQRNELWTVLSYDACGELIWSYRFDDPGSIAEYPRAIAADPFGGVIVAGSVDGPRPELDFDYVTLKFSPNGALEWERRYNGALNGSDVVTGVAAGSDGSFYVTGYSELVTGFYGNWDFLTIKYSAQGEEQWRRQYAGPDNGNDLPSAITVDPLGDVYVSGSSFSVAGGLECLTLKYDQGGGLLWASRGEAWSCGYGQNLLDALPDGSIIVSTPVRPGSHANIKTWKVSSTGATVWTHMYDNPAHTDDWSSDQVLDDQGNTYVCGRSNSGAVALRVNQNGTTGWSTPFPGESYSSAGTPVIALDELGNLVLAGMLTGLPYVFSLDADGDSLWTIRGDTHYSLGYQSIGLARDVSGGISYAAWKQGDGMDVVIAELRTNWLTELDILPGSCPNIINTGVSDLDYHSIRPGAAAANRPTVPVAILGTKAFDVSRVDSSTIEIAGLFPLSHRIMDVSRPVDAREGDCDCAVGVADGFDDLVLYFDQSQLIAALGPVVDGELRTVELAGKTRTGVPLSGSDCLMIKEGPIRVSPLASAGEKTEAEFAAYPNPFNAATVVSFSTTSESYVRLDVYDVLGRRVATLVDGMMSAGLHQVSWDAVGWSSGVYFARLVTANGMMTRKMVLVR